jgi:hypothetical protein
MKASKFSDAQKALAANNSETLTATDENSVAGHTNRTNSLP